MKTPRPLRLTWLVAGIRLRKIVGQAHADGRKVPAFLPAAIDS